MPYLFPTLARSTTPGAKQAVAGSEPMLAPPAVPDTERLGRGPLAPVLNRVATAQPVVFITIDDGWTRDPRVPQLIAARHLPVTVFLLNQAGRQDVGYFRSLVAAGATIEDHTLTHPRLTSLREPAQQHQICAAANEDQRLFGARPTLMRPPYGAMNRATSYAAAQCQLQAVVQWNATMSNGTLTVLGGHLQHGDIILLHFLPTLYDDLTRLLTDITEAGLTVGHLESYLRV
jgi:peptidoglycan/xylan/chitin deacetylase (PgdA/CDA1 family)